MTSRAGDEDADVAVNLQTSHRSFVDLTTELLMKTPLSVSKPADLGVGGPKLCVMDRWVTGDRGHDVYPGSGPLNGGNTLLPA